MPTINIEMTRAALVSNIEKWTNYPAGQTFKGPQEPLFQFAVFGFSEYPEHIQYRELVQAVFNVYVLDFASDVFNDNYVRFEALSVPFDENTVTRESLGTSLYPVSDLYPYIPSGPGWRDGGSRLGGLARALKYGMLVSSQSATISTPKSSYKPYVVITYGDKNVGLDLTQTYPTGEATISKAIATTFTWNAAPSTDKTLEPVKAASAKLRWKYSGASGYTEVACDKPTQHTIPANTFSEGTIQWQVVVTANSGTVTTSDWMTTAVKEPVSSAVASYPANSVIDGSMTQTFAWEHIISNGTAQYAFDLQTSPDGSDWTTIRHAVTAQTSAEFAAGTFVAGDLWWRVRTYNLAGTAGAWSDAVHCIVIAAPAAPSITADDTSPRFVLRWQQSGQQAYELMVDGEVVAKTFSAESIYRHDGYLEPGQHKVQVRIQNCYQMWSEWGTANLQIENVEGAEIQLAATGKNEVALSWNSSGTYDRYIVYRNGAKIAEVVNTSYIDQFAVGAASYQVRGVYADSGNYTLSNAVAVTISPETLLIADVSAPVWIKLPLSTSSLRSAGLSASQSVTYTHYIGSGLPGAEIGEAVSRSYNLDCAFKATDLESIRQFEALLGKVVCIKTPSQRRIVGVMSQMNARENRFYVSYSVPITEVRWEEMLA